MPQTAPLTLLVMNEQTEEIKQATISMRGFYSGCRVEAVYSADEALEWASKQDWHVMLLDDQLPPRSGLAILPELRRRAPNAAIIVQATHYDTRMATQAVEAGADYYLSKRSPTYLAELPIVAQTVLDKRDLRLQLDLAEERYLRLIETMTEMVCELDAEGRLCRVSPTMGSLLRYDLQELIGAHYSTLLHPEERPLAERRFNERRRGDRATRNLELRLVPKNGTVKQTEVVEVRVNATGLYSQQQRFVGTVGVVRDVSREKQEQVQRQQLAQQMRQLQTMGVVGRLAGGIAHEFNSLLTVIMGYNDLLLQRLSRDEETRRELQEIKQAGERAADLTSQLLTFSRRQILQPKVLDLNTLVAEMHQTLSRLISPNIQMVTALGSGLGRVKADPAQVRQVVRNLVANARDAMPQGGTLTITTANVELDETWARRHVGALPGPYVMITVSDTGVGMDAVTQACIFEPFFTTKAPGAGAGMGLATVYGFVKQSGGHIEVSSQPDHGATFTVYLPRLPETGLTETAPEPVAPSAGSTTVLLVEDDAGVRTLARMVLEEQGYMVLEAPNAEEAWRLAGQYRGTIHLLLTDVVMPGMSGHELVRRLSPLRQEMKVLYMSGYLEEVVPPPDLTAQGVAFLQKPFTPETLADTVRAVLRVQN